MGWNDLGSQTADEQRTAEEYAEPVVCFSRHLRGMVEHEFAEEWRQHSGVAFCRKIDFVVENCH